MMHITSAGFDLRADHLTFDGGGGGGCGMGDFRKKYPAYIFPTKKTLQGNTCHTIALYVGEKNSITRDLGKTILTQTKSPIPLLPLKSQMVSPYAYVGM